MNLIERVRNRLDGGRHWFQGGPVGLTEAGCGGVCLLLALDQDDDHAYVVQTQLISHVIDEQFPDRNDRDGYSTPIPFFNDHPDTTWDDVDLVLHKASMLT